MLDPPPGRKRRVRERKFGVIMRSLADGKWEIQWDGGEIEALATGSLKNEGAPDAETENMVRVYTRSR